MLSRTVDAGRENMVRLLLDAGESAGGGSRAVHSAVWHRQPRVVHMLLDAIGDAERELGASHEINGVTILHLASARGSLATV